MATAQLAKVERENRPEPFTLELTDGSEVTFADPKKLHFTVLTTMDEMSPVDQVKTLTGEGYEALAADPQMDGEALEWIMGLWRDHYGLGDQGEAGGSSGS
jgi:hypothetical protein